MDGFDWNRPGTFGGGPANVMFDDDLLMDFTDILFSSLSNNQPFQFPNPREIGKLTHATKYLAYFYFKTKNCANLTEWISNSVLIKAFLKANVVSRLI